MAEIGRLEIGVRLVPDDDTMKIILRLLDLWQDANPELMVAMVPGSDRYQYEIIPSGRGKKHGDTGDQRGDPEQRAGD